MTQEKPLKLSEHFPRAPPACEKVAAIFFACFYIHGKQPVGVKDPDTGTNALSICAEQLKAYNSCMDREMAKVPVKMFRVPQAYRLREDSNK